MLLLAQVNIKAREKVKEKPLVNAFLDTLQSIAAPPKKPPRRNLSASPTHPGMPEFSCEQHPLHPELMIMGRNKSLDEGVYGDRWRKSLTTYDTSQSTESIDLSPVESHKNSTSAKSDNIPGLNGSSANKSNKYLDSQFVSVAHIRLRDAKSEQNVSPSGGLSQGESLDDLDEIHHLHNLSPPNANLYAVVKHSKPGSVLDVSAYLSCLYIPMHN
jgi:hypothetical protein